MLIINLAINKTNEDGCCYKMYRILENNVI